MVMRSPPLQRPATSRTLGRKKDEGYDPSSISSKNIGPCAKRAS